MRAKVGWSSREGHRERSVRERHPNAGNSAVGAGVDEEVANEAKELGTSECKNKKEK